MVKTILPFAVQPKHFVANQLRSWDRSANHPDARVADRFIVCDEVSITGSLLNYVSAVSEANGTTVPVSLDLGSSLSIQPAASAARAASLCAGHAQQLGGESPLPT